MKHSRKKLGKGVKVKKIRYSKRKKGKSLINLAQKTREIYQETKAAVQTVAALDEKTDAQSTVTLMDSAYTGVKAYARWQKFKLKVAAKSGVMLGKGYYKAIRKIRNAEKNLALMDAAMGVKVECPHKAVRGPSARLSEKTKQQLLEKRRKAPASSSGTVGKSMMLQKQAELVRMPEPVLRNAGEYDISVLEERNKISSGRTVYVSSRSSAENLEQKNKVRSRTEERKTNRAPREREELHGTEKAESIADKNKVRSKKQKDNLRKKKPKKHKKKKKSSGTGRAALKREMKLFIMKQVLQEGEDSGAGELVLNAGVPMVMDKLQKIGKASMKLSMKLIRKLLIGVFTLLGHVLLGLLGLLLPLLLPFVLIITAVGGVVAIASLIAGLFVSPVDATRDDFATTVIQAHQEEVLEDAYGYKGKSHNWKRVEYVNVSYRGIEDINSNSDDILLAYFSKATNENKFEEDSGQAPLLNVNSLTEKNVMKDVLKEMLFIESVTYATETLSYYIVVTPTPKPATVGPPAPTKAASEVLPVPSPMPSLPPSLSPTPIVSPAPTLSPMPTPTPEPILLEVTEEYYVANVVIAGKSADEWVQNNLSKKEMSVYKFLLEMFKAFGYVKKGGDTVCQKYYNAMLE